MTNFQRVKAFFAGLMMLICSAVMAWRPGVGISLIALILCVTMLIRGLGALAYYATMARHMVGGKMQLFKGIIMLDAAMFLMTLDDTPLAYLLIYLLIANLFAGVIDVLRGLEAKRLEATGWKMNLATGFANILSGAICIFCIGRPNILVYVYAAGLFYTAVLRIASAFQKTAIVYIQ